MTNELKVNEKTIIKKLTGNSLTVKEFNAAKELANKSILVNIRLRSNKSPKELIYEIQGLEIINNYINKDIDIKEFTTILLKICKSYLYCEINDNLCEEKVSLDSNHVFIDTKNKNIRLMYLPRKDINKKENEINLIKLLRNITNTYSKINSKYSKEIRYILNSLENYTDICSLVEDLNNIIKDKPIKKVHKSKRKCKFKNIPFFSGVILILITQILTGILSYSLYTIIWDNPNVTLICVIMVVVIDMLVSLIIGNFLIVPSFKNNNSNKTTNIIRSENIKIDDMTEKSITSYTLEEYSNNALSKESYNNIPMEKNKIKYFEQVSVLGSESDDTELLYSNNEGEEKLATLINCSDENYERITIWKNNFIIGRLREKVDYPIQNQTVGKVHAKIIMDKSNFYLIDMNSKNGTKINGKKIEANKKYKLSDGDKIVFSNVEYEFKL